MANRRFAWLLLPLAAIVHLARTGDLVEAQLISLFSLALLTCVVVVGARLSPEMSLGWLMLLPLEAAIADFGVVAAFRQLAGDRHVAADRAAARLGVRR